MTSLKYRLGQFQFSTLISIAEDNIFTVKNHKIIKRFNSTRNPFAIKPRVIVADPFLFVYQNELYLFYEEQIELTGKGVIKMTKTNNLKNWIDPIIVLEEDFHLSYPNVFEINGDIFMMPETGNDGSIKLYSPNESLTKWSLNKTLLKEKHFVDSSLILHDNNYYLFTTDYTDSKNTLRLYWSEKLDGKWIEHSQSPIATGNNVGRCAGSVFKHSSKLFRPCQLTQKRYGEGVDIYEITVLSKEFYEEKRLDRIIPNNNKDYQFGGHHFNSCNFNNKIIVATDILEIRLNLWEILRRIVSKIKS